MDELSKVERIDRFGHCCYCSAYLLTKRVVDGKVVDMFTPQYDQTVFLLDNGSQMQITLCKKCKGSIDLNDEQVHADIMAAVMKGWELETKLLVANTEEKQWTEEFGKQYLDNMSKLDIDCHADTIDKNALEVKSKELATSFRENK